MKKLLLVLLLLYPLSAEAQTYQWTDERGTVNFADDLGKVPKQYRKKARVLGRGDDSAETVIDNAPQSTKPVAEGAEPGKKLYGGKDEATWRREFLQSAANLENAQSELALLKARLSDTSGMSRSEYLTIQNSIKHGEVFVQNLRAKQEQLRQAADRAGVPAEFRK